ncbi:MAG TPA: nitronate monooxygenase, partial [Micromonospora sp.]
MSVLTRLRRPVVGAPMAGGPSTPQLAVAVSQAGGLGFLAGGMCPVSRLRDDVARVRAGTDQPFGVNLFLPGDPAVDDAAIEAYAARLAPTAARWEVPLGHPTGGDDDYPAKLDALLADPVPVVSFVFGLPGADEVAALRARGSEVWATVTSPAGAVEAVERGVDVLVVQGTEAGGHRGGVRDDD